MSGITLYHFPLSTPSRIALIAARAVGVPIEIKLVNTFKREQYNEDFARLNPQHCIPTLDDNGFVLWESRAIATYLADKYGKDDQLYPKDLRKRALVDQRLYFDASFLFPKIRNIYAPVIFRDEKEVPEALKDDLKNTLGFLELFLEGQTWLAGDNYTIADTTISTSITALQFMEPSLLSALSNIERWHKLCSETLPGFEDTVEPAKEFGEIFRNKLES